MSYTISDRQAKNLFEKASKATSKGELRAVFKKYFPASFEEKKTTKATKTATEKKATTAAKTAAKVKANGYRIIWAKGGGKALAYPTSKYQKDSPIEAADSAMKGIIRKKENGLKTSDARFSFLIQNGDGPKYAYAVRDGKLTKASAESLSKPVPSSSWF